MTINNLKELAILCLISKMPPEDFKKVLELL
jgi:hypothetical protein